MIRSGRLRHKITIQETTQTQDSFGGITDSWAAITDGVVWASVEPLMGREYFDAKHLEADVDYRVRIRYLAGVTPKMRVLWGSRVFDIKAVLNPRELNHEMILMCRETV